MRAANCMRDYGTTNNTPAHQAPPVWRAPEGLEDLTAAQVGDGGACQHTNDKPDRSGAPRGLRGLAGHHTHRHPDRLEAAARPAGPGRGAGGRRQGLAGLRDDAPSAARGADGERAGRCPPAHTSARPNKTGHAAAGPGRASRSTTPSEARVWRSRGRGAAHRHQHAGTNTQPQTHRHNEAARPHRGRAAHASGR